MNRKVDTVCIVDPDEAVHDALAALLSTGGTEVVCHTSGEAFLDSDCASFATCSVLLVEAMLPGMGSLAFLRRLQGLNVGVPIIMFASTSNREIAEQALKAGALDVIEKPLVTDRLLELLRELTADTGRFVNNPDRE